MEIRSFTPSDGAAIYKLFCDTVHNVNARDYTAEQLKAWADGSVEISAWNASFMGRTALVAVDSGSVIGFGDITPEGYLDRLYVAHDRIRQGVGTALCNRLELPFRRVEVHASVTARPFFEARGYTAIRKNIVVRKGVSLVNFTMIKQ